jgi:hypothetical protein
MENGEFSEFEDKLFEIEINPDIKYSVDKDMESKIKYDYLVDLYGKERVDEVVNDYKNLFDHEEFGRIKKILG